MTDLEKTIQQIDDILDPRFRERIEQNKLLDVTTIAANGLKIDLEAGTLSEETNATEKTYLPNDNNGPWTHIPLFVWGLFQKKKASSMHLIDPYLAEGFTSWYKCVPIEVVAQFILDNGGFSCKTLDKFQGE